MEFETYEHGVPSWVDFSSPDLEASRAFYGALFGWDVPPGPPEAGGYSIAMIAGKPIAGIGPQMNPDMPPVWMTYVNVDSADDVAAKVTAAGGQTFAGPMDVMDVGRMAIFADPAGAVFGIWQAGTHKGAAVANEPNTYCWSELVTTDVPGAKAFYNAVFGWGSVTHGADGMGEYTEWKIGERDVGGMMQKPESMPAEVPPHWGVYFAVSDCDASAAKIGELGGAIFMGPMDIEPGRMAVAADPQGGVFNILAMKEAG
jgi:predicted enzyme related to lactoylglutathione lyase